MVKVRVIRKIWVSNLELWCNAVVTLKNDDQPHRNDDMMIVW